MLVDDSGAERIAERISQIEATTDAELVAVLAPRADAYATIPLLWAALAALFTPWLLWLGPWWLEAFDLLIAQAAILAGAYAVLRLPPVLRHVIPGPLKRWRSSSLARRQFIEQQLHHTRGGTGVLIFVSEAEHYVEILADQGIDQYVEHEQWQAIVDAFTARLRAGEVLDGFLECVDACGALLAEHVPATDAKNELPNHFVRLERL